LREECKLRVFENRILMCIFGPKIDEVTRKYRKLHNEVLNNLYSLLNIVRMIKLRIIRWGGNVARMGREWVYKGFWWGNLKGTHG
jgi:hypothetical protein